MQIIQSLAHWQEVRSQLNASIGFVPTMGNLHLGHLSLLERSRAENELTVLSIFINPTQFNQAHDFQDYPRTLAEDQELAAAAKVDYVLVPNYAELYPDDYTYQVSETDYSTKLEGEFRPGHFTGMLTVVLKLLLLVQAKRAYFGLKDYQQLQLIRGMVQAFFLPINIIGCEIKRNDFGLPYSSRNNKLSPSQYEQARHFPAIFHSSLSCAAIAEELGVRGFKVDYVTEYDGRRFAAVYLGEVRLIDNIPI